MWWSAFLLVLLAGVVFWRRLYKNRRVRAAGDRGEQIVCEIMEQAAPRGSIILRNLYLPASRGTTEIDLLLLTRKGIFVVETKNYSGGIYGDERCREWIKIQGNGRKVSFYNPIWQNEGHIRALLRALPDLKERFVYSYIVFCGSSRLKKVRVRSSGVRVLKDTDLERKLRWKLFFSFRKFSKKELNAFVSQLEKFKDADRRIKRQHQKQVRHLKKQRYGG